MARPRKETATLNKPAILRAAAQLIREGGEQAVTFRALAKRLGVTPMAVNYHVGSRKALLEDMIAEAFEGLDAPVSGITAADRLRALLLRYCQIAQENAPLIMAVLRDPTLMVPGLVGFTDRVRAETQALNDGDKGDVLLNLVVDYAHGFIFAMASAPLEYNLGEAHFLSSLDWVLERTGGGMP